MNQKKPAKKPQIKKDYKIITKLDAGGMGVVYKAVKIETQETIALKVLPPKFAKQEERLTRFKREILACSRLDHPNLIRIIDSGCEDNLHFFTMEFFPGLSIRKMLKRDGPFSLERTLDVALQIAKGCSYAHSKSLIHRDLKPDNILLDDNGMIKIIDFGLAKIRDITTMTRVDQALGTTRYLAPEIILGKPIDSRADIYQMGLIFHELLTGERVFTGSNPMAQIRAYVYGGQPLTSFGFCVDDDNWSSILYNCLSVKPEDRYKNTMALIGDLNKLKSGESIERLTSTSKKPSNSKKSLKKSNKPGSKKKAPQGNQATLRLNKTSFLNRIMPWVVVLILLILTGTAYFLRKVQIKDLVIDSTYDSVTIKWQTTSTTVSALNYSPMNQESFERIHTNTRGTEHSVEINGLEAGQRYRFHFILSGNRQSRQYVFKTQKPIFSSVWFIRRGNNETSRLSFSTIPPTICSIKYPSSGTTLTINEKEVKTKHIFVLREMSKSDEGKTKIELKYRLTINGPQSTDQWYISADQKSISSE